MYPSDYGYATSGGSTSNRTSCLNSELYNWDSASDCYNNDWLYNSSNWQWTVSSLAYSLRADTTFDVNHSGRVYDNYAYDAGLVRPSVYLKSSVAIVSGNGSKESPYELLGD